MKIIILLFVTLAMSACETTNVRVYNLKKPISEYDADLYKCKRMAMEMNPDFPSPRVTGSSSSCYVVGNLINCNQTPTYHRGDNVFEKLARDGKINSMTEGCMERQGWVKEIVDSSNVSNNRNNNSINEGVQSSEAPKESDYYTREENQSCSYSRQCKGDMNCFNRKCSRFR